MFPARAVVIIFDYVGTEYRLPPNKSIQDYIPAWLDAVEFIKRQRGKTKDGAVPFPQALYEMLGEQQTGITMMRNQDDEEPPTGMRYRQVVRTRYQTFLVVPRGVRLEIIHSDNSDSFELEIVSSYNDSRLWNRLEAKGEEYDIDPDYDHNDSRLWNRLEAKGEEYDIDPDYDHEGKPDGEPVPNEQEEESDEQEDEADEQDDVPDEDTPLTSISRSMIVLYL